MNNKIVSFFTISLLMIILVPNAFSVEIVDSKLPSPERGFVSTIPAKSWEMALVSDNGKYGALVFGQPFDETIVIN